MSAPGFNFFGHVTGDFGLGIAARSTLAWLLEERQSVCLRDVSTHDERTGKNRRYRALLTHRPWGLPFDINLFHLNPPEIALHIGVEWQLLPIERRLNVAVPFWELPSLPPSWRQALSAMDLVLAPTRYIHSVLTDNAPEIRCLHFPFVLDLPQAAPADRARFGLPERALIFLCAFDLASDIERKNPWAAINAFQTAFANQESACLVIKVNHAHLVPEAEPSLDRLRRLVRQDPRLILIDGQLSRTDLLVLFAGCDALVSLHRAEGLGMIIMEMMALGKPVLATAWSGNMDFTTPENACLVDYDLVPVQAHHLVYRQEVERAAPLWAEARVSSAAAWMRRLYENPELRGRIGQRAARDMRTRRQCGRTGLLVDILTRLQSPEVGASHRARARWFLEKRVRGLLGSMRRSPREFLGRMGALARASISSYGSASPPSPFPLSTDKP